MDLRCLHVPGRLPAVTRLFIACAIAALLAGAVVADPILGPFWVLDTPLSVVVSFSGSTPPTNVIGPFTSPTGFWRIASIDITDFFLVRDGNSIEGVTIRAMLQHAKGPHDGESAGQVFEFPFSFDASEAPINSVSFTAPPQSHRGLSPPDIDKADAVVHFGTDADHRKIKIFNITMEANHVRLTPEPASAVLLALGLALIIGVKVSSNLGRQYVNRDQALRHRNAQCNDTH